jgi:positive regulator of sigma E activity
MVQVQFERAESCKHCHACSGQECRALLPVPFADADAAKPGDTVEVEAPDSKIVRLSAISYGLPLVTLLAGVFLGAPIHAALNLSMNAELFCALVGGVFMLLGLLTLHFLDNKWAFRTEFQPRIVAVKRGPPPSSQPKTAKEW